MKKVEKIELITLISHRFSIDQCKKNPTTLFIFGDNLERWGNGGQAIIRGQINAIGLSTKKKPSGNDEDYFTDGEFENNCIIIKEEILKIQEYAKIGKFKAYAFPKFGLGTGLSAMQTRCPKTFGYLGMCLIDEFKFNNFQFLISQ